MRRNLVIVRRGPDSRHPAWLAGEAERNWDLLLCPYAESPPKSDFDVPPIVPGLKWTGLLDLLTRDPRWRAYDYIWLPDDDLEISGSDLNRFFELCRRFQVKLAAPSLSEDSFFTFPHTMHNRSFFARATNFVEGGTVCFRRDVLQSMLPVIAQGPSGWGWGLDYAWANLLEKRGLYIFDAVQVRHGRPVGWARSADERREGMAELRDVAGRFGGTFVARTLYACDETGRRLEMSRDRFLAAYLKGYEYLIERAPQVRARLLRQQAARRRRYGPRRRLRDGLRRALQRLLSG